MSGREHATVICQVGYPLPSGPLKDRTRGQGLRLHHEGTGIQENKNNLQSIRGCFKISSSERCCFSLFLSKFKQLLFESDPAWSQNGPNQQ